MWRAGLPCVGLRSSPLSRQRVLSGRPHRRVLGPLRSPTRASSLATVCAAFKSCGARGFCGEQACPALGCAAAPDPGSAFFQADLIGGFWGRSAAQREQARSPQSASPSSSVVSEACVASRLALRWAAQQPRPRQRVLSGTPRRQVLGPLRSPTRASSLATVCVVFKFCGERGFCGEQACPALGCAAAPYPGNAFFQADLIGGFWGRFAAQREQARSPQSASFSSSVVSEASVASRLALRWAAQQPPTQAARSFRHTSSAGFGAASQPSASKLARHSLRRLQVLW
ncbi:hypothetical protein QF043_001576 [Pseudomonas sp. W3I7]|nr:hypothetical protein [Pseudomonas sp. W3I7]